MPFYISLLRGINVSGQKKILMKDLKSLYEDAGCTDVQTYIQSGNVVFKFSGKKNKHQIEKLIEGLIKARYGFDVTTLVLSPHDLNAVIENNPFLNEPDFEAGKMYVCFLKETPATDRIEKIKDVVYESDRFTIACTTIYLFVPGGYGNTKLNNNFFEAKLKVAGTTRNWNTAQKLLELSQ